MKDRLGRHFLGAGANGIGRAARPAEKLERVNEQRRARPRFAGEYVESGARLDGELFDDSEITDFQICDHGLSECTVLMAASLACISPKLSAAEVDSGLSASLRSV